MNLKKAATAGIIWTFLDTVVGRGIGIIAAILLARMLSPREFGLLGMIYIFTGIATSLADSGMSASLIRHKEADALDYTTVFYTNLFFAGLVYGLLFLAAPAIAAFYQEPALVPISKIYGLLIILRAFSAVQVAILSREMDFKKLMILSLPGTLIGAVFGVLLAANGWKVWSLIGMQLLNQTIYSILLWWYSRWKPSWHFSKERLKIHYSFGYKLMLSGLLNTVFDNLYNLIIGKFFSVTALGFFERAKKFNQYPVSILTGIIGRVAYPLLSGIQGQRERLASVYKQILQFIFFVAAPSMLLLSVVAVPLFTVVLGGKWVESAVLFKILCFSAILYPIHVFNLNLLKVEGRSDLFLRLEIIKKIIVVVVVIASFPFGLKGLVWGMVLTSFLALVVNTHYTQKLINYSLFSQILDMRRTIIALVVMYAVAYFLAHTLLGAYALGWQIILPLFAGSLVYLLASLLLKNPALIMIAQIIKK